MILAFILFWTALGPLILQGEWSLDRNRWWSKRTEHKSDSNFIFIFNWFVVPQNSLTVLLFESGSGLDVMGRSTLWLKRATGNSTAATGVNRDWLQSSTSPRGREKNCCAKTRRDWRFGIEGGTRWEEGKSGGRRIDGSTDAVHPASGSSQYTRVHVCRDSFGDARSTPRRHVQRIQLWLPQVGHHFFTGW